MNNALISVIIPTFKGSSVIGRAINSVLSQTYPFIEIIVVDDNSPDSAERKETEAVMSSYDYNTTIVYLRHSKNKNGAAARNTGIKHSHGSFIAFLDDDDWFLPNKIERQLDYLTSHSEFAACYCLAQREGKPIKTIPYQGDLTKELLLMESKMFTPSLFFRRNALVDINGFDESFRRHQDYEMLLRFFAAGNQIGCLQEVLLELGTGGGDNNPSPDKILELKRQFLTKFSDSIEQLEKKEPGFRNRAIAIHYGSVFLNYVLHHRYIDAMSLFFKYSHYSFQDFTLAFRQRLNGYITRRINGGNTEQ